MPVRDDAAGVPGGVEAGTRNRRRSTAACSTGEAGPVRCWSGATPRSTTARCASSTAAPGAGVRPRGHPRDQQPAGVGRLPRHPAQHVGGAVQVTAAGGSRGRARRRIDRGDARRRLRVPALPPRRSTSTGAPTSAWREIQRAGPLAEVGDGIERSAPRRGRRTAGSWTPICFGGDEGVGEPVPTRARGRSSPRRSQRAE